MISERSGDGKMMIGVEIDMEIEEGEASYFQNGDKKTIDPDVSLSYIDERIQDILGHFQRDFEGGVSAENLGAKFGGYGSFLPTYARSPACSQQRTASEVIDGNTPKFSRILDLEASQLSSLASSCSSPPLRLEGGSTANPKGQGSIIGPVKGDGRVPFNSVETPTLKDEQKSEFPCDQRTLKVRLRVGNNLPAKKNAEIYSGLGLDGSPSPSLNESYTGSEGLSHGIRDPSGNSPTSILKVMTSFLLQGTQLLSPLSEDLICFAEKEKYSRESVSKSLHKGKVNRYESRKDVREPLPAKKTCSYENGDFLEAGEHRNVGLLLKRETDVNDLDCEELATNVLKLPLLSNTPPGPLCPAEGSVKSSDHVRVSNIGPSSMRSTVEQPSEQESVQEIGRIQKSKGNVAPSLNISIHKKENLVDNCTVTTKPSRHKGQRNIVSAKVELGLPEREKAPKAELFDSRETKSMQAAVSNDGVIGNQAKPPGHLGNNLSVVSSTGLSNSAHSGQMLDQQVSRSGDKKRQKSKDDSSGSVCGEPLQLSKSMKNHQEKNKSLDCVNWSSLVDSNGTQYVGQCSSSVAEKHVANPHKKSSLESYSAGGDAKKSKSRKRRQSDSDSSRSSKKVKLQDVIFNDENGMSAPPVHLLESGNCLGNSSPDLMPRKDRCTTDGYPKDVKNEFPYHITATEITYDEKLPNHKCDDNDKSSSRKNEGQGELGTRSYLGDLPQIGHRPRCNSVDNERKVKKAKTSNSEGQIAITRKSTCETGKKARNSIDQIGQVRGIGGTADYSKIDLGTVHPSVASTSSSSKVSGTIKTSCQEVKGSSVESVSSSPLRVLSTDKCALPSRNPLDKDHRDITFVDNCSPKGVLVGAVNKVDHATSVESSVVNLQDEDPGFVSGSKIKEDNRSSSDFASQPINDVDGKGNQDTCKNQSSERYRDERKDDRTFNGGSHSRKLENGVSLHNGRCTIASEKDKVRFTSPESNNGALDIHLSNGELTGGSSVNFDKDEKNCISEKSSGVKDFGAISDHETKPTPGFNDHLDDKIDMKESIVLDRDVQDASNKHFSDIRSASEISGSGKAYALPPSARFKNFKGAHLPQNSGPHKENAVDISLCDIHGNTFKAPEQNKKGETQNGSTPSRHSNSTMHKVRDHDGSSVRKDSRSQAATNAMKEAKDLKRLADRFKNSGSADSTGMYFEAALKFLYGASLLESGSRGNNKHNDIQCIDMYRSTAKFCEFCAHEYERSKDMVSAALAYKCMEVSYMRVIYTSHGNTNRDRNEVQMALQIVPPGESPASSASDVDNLNNPVIVDKVSTSKGMTSPQVAGSTGITARNRSSFSRLLEFAQDISAAMDAAKKSRSTFAAANLRSGDAKCGDGISSVKRALDFNFQDVEGLLRVVRIAKDAISR